MFTCGLLRWIDSLAMVVVVLLETVEIYRDDPGARRGIRTPDLILTKDALYP